MPIKERAKFLTSILLINLMKIVMKLGLMDCVWIRAHALVGMKGDVDWSSDTLRYFAGMISEIKGERNIF